MSQLLIKSLTVGYDGKAVVSGLTFTLERGDYLCIVGENGSGKSTLMRTLLGLNPPVSGEIVTGDDLSKNEIGYLPQHSEAQKDFPATVEEVVLSGCLGNTGMHPFYSQTEKKQAEINMDKLGISDISKSCYRELSGGQQQRALLARALCSTGKILLMDEPVAGLDPVATSDMYSCIKALNEEGITIIMISHDITSSVKYASHILHIGEQSPLFFGTVSDYLKSSIGSRYAAMGGENE